MQLKDYQNKYSSIKIQRSPEGILELTLHTRGEQAKWGVTERSLHAELGHLFADIARDHGNKIVILTGTGENFIAEMDRAEPPPEPTLAAMWERIYEEGVALLDNLLNIPVPVIAAVNGPALIHAELAVLSDIVIAADHAQFADRAHMINGAVPGDGVQTVWLMLLGPNRGRYFLLTGEHISAQEARTLGFVAEVLPANEVLPRAQELAKTLAAHPTRTLRHTRTVLIRNLRARLRDELQLGIAIEALATLTK